MRWVRAAAALAVMTLALGVVAAPAGAVNPSLIQGSGSSWAFPALTIWISGIKSAGVQVVYNPDGDAAGRQDFANRVSDFSVTSDGYLGFTAKNGTSDTSDGRQYAYLPIASGGTSFAYHITVDGTQDRTLRLSGETLAKIFTGGITNWDNATITKNNNGVALPSLPIIPIVQSQGSGATEQLTNYFAREYPSIWQSYSGLSGPTEYYPDNGVTGMQPVDGSSGAINYVTSSEGNGSIAYVEYSYALDVGYPVAKILNSAGYYTLPTKYNVAVSLEAAIINENQSTPDYLLQTLDNVYTDTDPRTYPLSSYVYMIEPTGTYPNPETKITTGKRQSLADFEYFSICQGQTPISNIGYSPLPVNLVEAGFGQLNKLKAAAPAISITKETIYNCNNPTFVPGQPNENYLAEIAPMPPTCDKTGAGPCGATVTPNGLGSTPNKSGTYGSSSSSSSGGSGSGSSTAGTAAGGSTAQNGGGGPGASTRAGSGSLSSSALAAARAAAHKGTGGVTGVNQANSSLVSASLPEGGGPLFFGLLAAGLLLLTFGLPVAIGYRRSRRKREAGS